MSTPDATARADERIRRQGAIGTLFQRPEIAAAIGTVVVWLAFAAWAGDNGFLSVRGTANYLEIAAQLGIIGAPVALLIISGEFDLSLGSMVGAAGMILALVVGHFGLPIWLGLIVSLAFALAYGFANGFLVVRTGLPSFLITLASLFILRGLSIALARLVTGSTVVGGLHEHTEGNLVASFFTASIDGFAVSIFWWAIVALLCHWVLMHTNMGNWIFGTGGSTPAARSLGVPTSRVKITLFMGTAMAAWLLAAIQVLDVGSADANRGLLKEFEAIIVAVIGGTLLRGGYGTVVGTIFGALTLAITQQGLFFASVDSEYYRMGLGFILLIAVLMNELARRRAGVKTTG